MIRTVTLENYLPEYLKEYKELFKIMEVENPEFNLAIEETEKILNNLFINSCDENGISRFEKIMNIYPFENDRLQTRISRVLSRWYEELPYSYNFLIKKLNNLCGVNNYELEINGYELSIASHFEYPNQIEELKSLLDKVLPANMKYLIANAVKVELNDIQKVPIALMINEKIVISEEDN